MFGIVSFRTYSLFICVLFVVNVRVLYFLLLASCWNMWIVRNGIWLYTFSCLNYAFSCLNYTVEYREDLISYMLSAWWYKSFFLVSATTCLQEQIIPNQYLLFKDVELRVVSSPLVILFLLGVVSPLLCWAILQLLQDSAVPVFYFIYILLKQSAAAVVYSLYNDS